MKKITAFFMALLPIIMMVLLFAAGIIVKNSTHVYVQSVELPDKSLVVQKSDEQHDKTVQLTARVLPMNATNPELYWKSSDENILTVDNTGNVSCKKYGEAFVYAISKENQTFSSSCKIEVNDKEIHQVIVSDADKYNLGYIGLTERKKINTTIVPATGVIDPTLVYEVSNESKDYVDVTQDGLILPKKETGKTKAKILIHPATGTYKDRTTEVDVQIGPGVQQLSLNDKTQTITSSNKYSIYDQLKTYPDKNVAASDYIYTSDDENIATVDAEGIVTFKRQGTVNVTSTYKRNSSLSVSKSITSTCNSILDVNFNCDKINQNINCSIDGKYEPADIENLYCDVYPQTQSTEAKYDVVSSDSSIVLPQRQSNGSFKFTALKPGCVMLIAYPYTSETTSENVLDACYVTVTSINDKGQDLGIIKNNSVTLPAGIYYYPLINALNLQADNRTPYEISYSLPPTYTDATIDDNGILHFSKASEAEVEVSIDNKPTGTIKVKSSDYVTGLDVKDTLVVNVGQRYNFKNATPVFKAEYKDYFDVDTDNNWVAKNGCKIEGFELSLPDGKTKTITLIVKEQPIYIQNTKPAYFSTPDSEYNYKQEAGITIVPSTATKEDGTPYNLSYAYEFSNDSIKIDEDGKITFTKPGLVQVKNKCDGTQLSLKSWFKSTNGLISKFVLTDSAGKEVISNTNVTYEGKDLVYKVNNLEDLTQTTQIQIKDESELCDIDREVIENPDQTYSVKFTIKPKSTKYGKEAIGITSGTHTVYLNVIIPAVITNVDVMYGREILSDNGTTPTPITSYVNSLTLNIIPYPALEETTKEGAYSVKLDGTVQTVKDNQVTIDLSTTGHKLEIFDKTDKLLKSYTFDYVPNYQGLEISMIGADKDKNLYMSAKETQKVLYLKANGLVPLNFFQTDKFKVNLDDSSVKADMQQDILTISDLPKPDGTDYSLKMTLMYDTKELGKFTLTRDIVSKIVLPKHDNTDLTDKKGLQKVHVYGDRSYYNTTEKEIQGYRLPIEVYDYKGDLITNTTEKPDLKTNAIKTLNLSINKNCSAVYDEKNDCILIKFAKETLYDENEISQNLFDSKDGAKNVTFSVATKSQEANAKYTFVPVNGTNVYNQEGLKTVADRGGNASVGDNTVVLQINFGVPGLEKDNTKFENNHEFIGGIYGNGYTMCTAYQAEHTMSNYYLGIHFAFNTMFEGCSDQFYQTLVSTTEHKINFRNMANYKRAYFMYCVYKNFSNGMGYGLDDEQKMQVKNSLFFNNKVSAFATNDPNADAFIENCVFFDCGGLPGTISNGGFHFKGYVGIYNFHNKEAFKDIFGYDVSSLWPIVESAAKLNNMSEVGADGRTYINFFMVSTMTDKFYFWNSKTQQYEKGEAGTPDAANFIAKFIDIKIPFTSITAALWGTYNKSVDPSAFSYYDEYDKDGKIRTDFLAAQISKLVRKPIYF